MNIITTIFGFGLIGLVLVTIALVLNIWLNSKVVEKKDLEKWARDNSREEEHEFIPMEPKSRERIKTTIREIRRADFKYIDSGEEEHE